MPVLLLPALLLASSGSPALVAPSAQDVVAKALAEAKATKRNVFVHFGASWCGWCHRLEALLNDSKTKPGFERSYVEIEIVVLENKPEMKSRENAGGLDYLQTLAGTKETGLPYFAILDASGKKLVDSTLPPKPGAKPANFGYPGLPEEIAKMLQIVDRTGKFKPAERAAVVAKLSEKI